MLKPKDSDIPVFFLVLVVLPLVTYILLGRWSEPSKRKERISLLAQLASEESIRTDTVFAASVMPFVSPPKAALYECARCHAPATTRCSRCRSARYCSGKCQIIHWRHIHKDECQPIKNNSSSSKPVLAGEPAHEQPLANENVSKKFVDGHPEKPLQGSVYSGGNDSRGVNASVVAWSSNMTDASKMLKEGRKSTDKRTSRKSCREVIGRDNRSSSASADGISRSRTHLKPSKEAVLKNELRVNGSVNSGNEFSMMCEFYSNTISSGRTLLREAPYVGLEAENYGCQEDASCPSECARNGFEHVTADTEGNQKFYIDGVVLNGKGAEGISLPEIISNGGTETFRQQSAFHSNAIKISNPSKLLARSSMERSNNGKEKKGHMCDEPVARIGNILPAQGGNGITSKGFLKMMGLKKSSKVSKKNTSEKQGDGNKQMLFPYEEFVKLFQYEIFDLIPRGLSNIGNSCYANAVLQCLTCTKPLGAYLLKRTHSKSCCVKRWCLMCELEQHVATLRGSAGPLSPSRILSHMRNMNCSMVDGSQEDAHEFLRLLVASMQSICLKEVGGEKHASPSLQETTFIQHTFGGRLRSKVECLKCHHWSERCENIMDLTLEIFGSVESLEDALTQFTAWEDLDGDNMYKCGRCASYVQARKQLSIDEAPNILTIVLKRFQEGNYGKINKCITFPEMLDMIPFMTGTYDIPPLYMLYAVVVHMDTLNASFSGHYVSYVKDPHGNWLRIDDSEVEPVPMSHVMSEGAYILFYMRSFPRPSPTICSQTHASTAHRMARSSSRTKSVQESSNGVESSMIYNHSHTSNDMLRFTPVITGTYSEFPDAAASSSEWSLFTSSDDASFTTESTRDSFSTTANDCADMCNPETVTSFFSSLYPPDCASQRTAACRVFSESQTLTGFARIPSCEDYVYHHHDFEAYGGNSERSSSQTTGSCFRQ